MSDTFYFCQGLGGIPVEGEIGYSPEDEILFFERFYGTARLDFDYPQDEHNFIKRTFEIDGFVARIEEQRQEDSRNEAKLERAISAQESREFWKGQEC